MTGRTENHEIANLIIRALAIDMANLQNIGNPEAAVRTHGRIVLKCELPIVDTLHR